MASLSAQTDLNENSPDGGSRQASPITRVALGGNPNAGKTTVFNALTGLRYKVANYPGVTVEKREGTFVAEDGRKFLIVDLPGIYSLFGHSVDEIIATKYLLGEMSDDVKPDLIVSIVDASNLERNLYLVTQLIDLGYPVFVVLNMMDVCDKRGIVIRQEILSKKLGAPVISLVASKGKGVDQLKREIGARVNLADAEKLKSETQRYAWLPSTSPFREKAMAVGKMQLLKREIPSAQVDALAIGAQLLAGSERAVTPEVERLVKLARQELATLDIDPASFEAEQRYRWISEALQACCVYTQTSGKFLSDRIDRFVTHPVWGTLIFVSLMCLMFQAIFSWAEMPMQMIETGSTAVGNWIGSIIPAGQVRSLLVDGIIAGVGSVLIFIPQIAILYFFIGLLEDSGYLSRAAFLMDRIMRRFGLQGRSFIPLLSSFACAIPGIMSARVIPSFADRMATILIAPLMSCSARLPVYTLLIAAFIPPITVGRIFSLPGLTLLSMYLLGIIAAAGMAWILKSTLFRGTPSHLVMEMPPYRAPSMKLALRNVIERVTVFVKDAGTVILACSIVLWFLASYPRQEGVDSSTQLKQSFAGQLGHAIEPLIKPLGFDWKIGISLLSSFAAREVFVSSMATVYNLDDADENSTSLITSLRQSQNDETGKAHYNIPVALSLMVFYVFACQCMSTLAICRRETGSWKWPVFMFGYMMVLAYVGSLVTYRLASHFIVG